ncbi:facilitated trehalose transporter Tret1-like isoform X1 [Macrobrachium nipponense]|uniref:facilitated trehalose transporter Tret1-like isoform X1 n=2 Tax=Macrobrachium nipponense TaxID=159736 RepID=UPI0030C83F15
METSVEEPMQMKEPKNARRIRYAKQCFIVLTAGLVSISSGMIQLWPNVLASHLVESNTTIFGNEISFLPWQLDLVASVTQIGSLVGFLTAGYLVSRVGRRWSLVITAIPGVFGAVLITLAVNNYMIIIGRFLDGITNGMMNVALFIYAAEISDPKIRGSMCMLSHILMQSGGLMAIALGVIMSWYYVALICGCILVVHCLLVPTLKESPSFLAIKNRDDEALDILRKLRGSYADVKEELAYLHQQNQNNSKRKGFGVLLKREHLKKIALMSGIFFVHNFCGTQILRVNATRQLQTLGLDLDQKLTTILVIVLFFLGNFFMTIVLDKLGRRRCFIASLTLVAVSYITLASFMISTGNNGGGPVPVETALNETLSSGFNATLTEGVSESPASSSMSVGEWLPLLCLMVAGFGHAMGIGPLVWVLSPEMFPTNIRSQGTGICTMIGSLQTFAVLQLYSLMSTSMTPAGLYLFFAGVSIFGIIFIYFFLKETSGSRVG